MYDLATLKVINARGATDNRDLARGNRKITAMEAGLENVFYHARERERVKRNERLAYRKRANRAWDEE